MRSSDATQRIPTTRREREEEKEAAYVCTRCKNNASWDGSEDTYGSQRPWRKNPRLLQRGEKLPRSRQEKTTTAIMIIIIKRRRRRGEPIGRWWFPSTTVFKNVKMKRLAKGRIRGVKDTSTKPTKYDAGDCSRV